MPLWALPALLTASGSRRDPSSVGRSQEVPDESKYMSPKFVFYQSNTVEVDVVLMVCLAQLILKIRVTVSL